MATNDIREIRIHVFWDEQVHDYAFEAGAFDLADAPASFDHMKFSDAYWAAIRAQEKITGVKILSYDREGNVYGIEDEPPAQPDVMALSEHDEFLVVSAVRYARGRATYIVRMTVDWVIAHWDEFSDRTKDVIARDVREECEYRDNTPRSVLSEIDDPDWHRLNQHIKENQ